MSSAYLFVVSRVGWRGNDDFRLTAAEFHCHGGISHTSRRLRVDASIAQLFAKMHSDRARSTRQR